MIILVFINKVVSFGCIDKFIHLFKLKSIDTYHPMIKKIFYFRQNLFVILEDFYNHFISKQF